MWGETKQNCVNLVSVGGVGDREEGSWRGCIGRGVGDRVLEWVLGRGEGR